MSGELTFVFQLPVLPAILIALLQPVFLWLLTLVPFLAGRNPIQFALSSVIGIIAFAAWLIAYPVLWYDALVGCAVLLSSNLIFLEIWALLSRGYTIGLVLTLFKAQPAHLTPAQLAEQYRGGDGIEWIMQHRLSGLIQTGIVAHENEKLRLTSFPGLPVVWLYKFAIRFLGLRRTG